MKKTIEVTDIVLTLNYQFERFFTSQIDAYQTSKKPDYSISCEIVDSLTMPNDTPAKTTATQRLFKNAQGQTLYAFYHGKLAHRIHLSVDKKHYTISLSKQAYDNLDEVEYVLTGMVFFDLAYRHEVIALHASAVVYNDTVTLLSAPSGTGKTTLAKRVLKKYQDAFILNDDKPLLYKKDTHIYITGSPWSGSEGINQNKQYPLNRIIFLKQGMTNKIDEMHTTEKVIELMRNLYRPKTINQLDIVEPLLDYLLKNIDIVRYYCLNDDTAIDSIKMYF